LPAKGESVALAVARAVPTVKGGVSIHFTKKNWEAVCRVMAGLALGDVVDLGMVNIKELELLTVQGVRTFFFLLFFHI